MATTTKSLKDAGFEVRAENVGANHANTAEHLPLGFVFALYRRGERVTEHVSHRLAWCWAQRLQKQII